MRTESEEVTAVVGGTPFEDLQRAPAPLDVGQAVGRYVLLRPIAEGGMGIVYLAFDPELDRRVALKLIRPDRTDATQGGSGQLRLLREAQALARLSHPNVVHIYDVGVIENRVYLAMQFVEGQTLDKWLEARPRSWREIVDVLARAGRGLAAAHRAGLVHLDFKPQNVLVGEDGGVRVLDFGLARAPGTPNPDAGTLGTDGGSEPSSPPPKAHSRLGEPVTDSGVIMGTPGYVAPELFVKGRLPDPRADQFSYAVTAWKALYAQFPFPGEDSSERRRNARAGNLRTPPRDPRVPTHIHQALARALDPDPSRRFPSLDQILAELERDPSRQRKRVALGGLLVLGLGSGAYAYEASVDRRLAFCQDAESHLAEVWDDPRREAIRDRFLATATPYAPHAAASVERGLDRHTQAWISMRTDACEATHIRGEQSEAMLDRRMNCLDQRLSEVEALTDLFLDADASVVERAVQATVALSPLDECADPDLLLQRHELAPDETTREQIRVFDGMLARANALGIAGRLTEAIEIGESAIVLADSLDRAPLRARARYDISQFHDEIGDGTLALDMLEQALWIAERGDNDLLRAQIYTQMIFVAGGRLARHDDAHWFARAAHSVLDRVGGDPLQRARIHSLEAVIYTEEGKFDLAIAGHEQALAIHQNGGRVPGLDVAAALNNMGGAYYLSHQLDAALEHYERALELWEAELGSDHPQVAAVHGNIGNVRQQRGETALAIESLSRSARIEEAAKGENSFDVAVALNNLAVAYQVDGNLEDAARHYERAAGIFEKIAAEHPSHGACLSNFAEVLNDLDEHDKARGYAERANEVLDALFEGDHPYKAFAANSLGEALLGQHEVDAAIVELERAIRIFTETGIDPLGLGDAQFALARALRESDEEAERVAPLVEAARHSYRTAGKRGDTNLRQLDTWARAPAHD